MKRREDGYYREGKRAECRQHTTDIWPNRKLTYNWTDSLLLQKGDVRFRIYSQCCGGCMTMHWRQCKMERGRAKNDEREEDERYNGKPEEHQRRDGRTMKRQDILRCSGGEYTHVYILIVCLSPTVHLLPSIHPLTLLIYPFFFVWRLYDCCGSQLTGGANEKGGGRTNWHQCGIGRIRQWQSKGIIHIHGTCIRNGIHDGGIYTWITHVCDAE